MSTPVEQIKQRLSILDVVGSYVVLQKAGKSFKGKSPFTQERTPSFFVSPERGMYYCFSTNKGGDMFTFIQEMEGVDFKGALKILAERANVELRPVDPKEKDERDQLFALLEDATRFFEDALMNARDVREYLTSRGVKDETVHKWRIGFAVNEWRALKEYLLAKHYSETQIFKAGLLKKPDDSAKGSYDVFRNRVMFPIMDASGRVVGFSGRTLSSDAGTPKYVNSPETDLYQKSQILFGYDKARHGIRTLDFSLVVEGQFDLVLSHQAGYSNTVALSGTALTPAHVTLLSRLSNRIVLALDADRAGINSVKRSAGILLRRGMDVKVARIEGGKDPADLVREDPKLLRSMVGNATHVIEFLLTVLKTSAKDDRQYRLLVREEVVPFLALMPNHIDREHFVGVVADALGVTKDAIRHEVVHAEEVLAKESVGGVQYSAAEGDAAVHHSPDRVREHHLVDHLLGVLVYLEERGVARDDGLSSAGLRAHLEFVLDRGSLEALLAVGEEDRARRLFEAEMALEGLAGRARDEIALQLRELHLIRLRKKLAEMRERLKDAEAANDRALLESTLQESHTISEQIKHIVTHNPFFSHGEQS